ncbi:alpha-L-rhamnosidase-like protein [Novosphingobium sp. PhB57]|uniref:glycosyl hydrolase n=1 Tax=Novosphingobium sp. PhB57 TaxID=2485107 RepID=UPI0010508044|nr:glycosyl hydrolase [Novosphingobium sp. PhB57]TCU58490.1 alpha-L-rhamnosidase-like protein [Novosphingobium sp. PhB57]
MNRSVPRSSLLAASALGAIWFASVAHAEAPVTAAASASADTMETEFRAPPVSARPRVWWHWMNGNITEEGIRKELEWMSRIGLGGVQNFDANQDTPQVVAKRLPYMSPDWQRAFRVAASTADKLGLELGIASSPGWSETGGPWVRPEDGMKKLSWSETVVTGRPRGPLMAPAPRNTTGPYRDLPGELANAPAHYEDIATFAYRLGNTRGLSPAHYRGSDGSDIDAAALSDDRLTTSATIKTGSRDNPAIVSLAFDKPQTVRSLTLFVPGIAPNPRGPGLLPRLESSTDGQSWTKVIDIPVSDAPSTVGFAATTATHFRVVFAQREGARAAFGSGVPPKLEIRELSLSSEDRVNMFEAKAGFSTVSDFYALDTGVNADASALKSRDVIDLTDNIRPDGTIDWKPPAGTWRIVRLGWSLIGKANHPASAEATGLEVDKMDAGAVRRYLEHYFETYRTAAGASLFGEAGVRALVNDSTEVGPFNWTGDMAAQFRRLRGYELTPWLPVLTGAIVGSRQQSDAFLYDFRRTIGELHATEHYGTIAKVARENGLTTYGEAVENARSTLGDDMQMRSFASYPMAAMWYVPRNATMPGAFVADVKGAASVAHVYGQNIAAAESLTSIMMPWATGPNELKSIIDYEFALGINRPVIHTSVHQPVDDKVPGLSLGMFGQYFTRHETWAELAKPWIDYIARSAYMLQQGHGVADVAYFYGEEAPLTSLFAGGLPSEVPRQYGYDFLNTDALLRLASVDGSDLVMPSGARYRVLFLGGSSRFMTLPVLQRLADLAEQGATIVGEAPVASPSLADDPAAFDALVKKLWLGSAVTRIGRGKVVAGQDLASALGSIGAVPDFDYPGEEGRSLLFQHRRLADGDVYFVSNRKDRAENVEARFRITGKLPELWRATTGKSEPVSYRIEGDHTIVPLQLASEDAVFVVFRKPAQANAATVSSPTLHTAEQLDKGWRIHFEPDRGAPAGLAIDTLSSLSEDADPGVRYFSGVATYSVAMPAPKGWRPGQKVWIDLGDARDVAEISINGKRVGCVWHAPFRIEATPFLQSGTNRLEVKVANLWVNRLIGDQQPGATKVAWTAFPAYSKTSKLRPSGLLGPVRILTESAGEPGK